MVLDLFLEVGSIAATEDLALRLFCFRLILAGCIGFLKLGLARCLACRSATASSCRFRQLSTSCSRSFYATSASPTGMDACLGPPTPLPRQVHHVWYHNNHCDCVRLVHDGLKDTPSAGRLRHHLGRDIGGEECTISSSRGP